MPLQGFAGGLMIGLAAAMLLLGNGRIAGVSGLFARSLNLSSGGPPRGQALAFVLGLPIGAGLVAATVAVDLRFPASLPLLALGGLLVGFGTRLGSGCTSGHGVCGLSRLSPRSIAATGIFMGSGIATVTTLRFVGILS